MAALQRVAGTVRWFSGQKGFGFIAPDSGGEDVFVHQTSIQSDGFRTLYEGEAVEFVIDLGEDGRSKATDVLRVGGSRSSGGGRGRSRGRGGGGRRGRFDDGYSGYGGGGDYGRGGARIDGEGRRGRFDDGYGGRGGGRIDGGGGGGGSGACYNCGRTGHLARDCYHNSGGGGRRYDGDRHGRGGYSSRRGRGGYGGGGRGRFGGEYTNISANGGPLTCYNCGEEGHFARGCPNVKIDNT